MDNAWKIGGVAGILFVVLMVGGIIGSGDSPHYGDTPADVRTFFADHANQYVIGDWVITVAFILFFVPFATALRDILASVESSGLWARISWAGALIFLALSGASAAAFGVTGLDKAKELDDSTLQMIMAWDDYAFGTAVVASGLMTAAASLVILRTGVVWKWISILGFAQAIVAVVQHLASLQHDGQGALDGLQLLALLLFAIWTLAIASMMLVHKEPTAANA